MVEISAEKDKIYYDSMGSGYKPLPQEIIQNETIKHLELTGDRYFDDGTASHIGSNGWPPNLITLSLKDCCNLFVKSLKVDTLQVLTLPFIGNLFGDWVDVLHGDARYCRKWGDEGKLHTAIYRGVVEDDKKGEVLQFMPQLHTVYLQDGYCCSENDFLCRCDEWLNEEFTFDDYADDSRYNWTKNMPQWLEQHSFWQNYRDRGYTINVTDRIRDKGCTVRLTQQ